MQKLISLLFNSVLGKVSQYTSLKGESFGEREKGEKQTKNQKEKRRRMAKGNPHRIP